jgi:tetratricopeptide (TPR) repeat protein
MSITIAQYLKNKLTKNIGDNTTVSDESIGRSLLIGHMLSRGEMTLKELLPSIKQNAQLIYAAAYEFYQKDQFEKAYNLFTMLCIYDPKNTKYLEGLAVTAKLLKKYNEALFAWYTLTEVDPIKLSYYLDLAEMFYRIHQIEAAVKCCEVIERLAQEEPFKSENDDIEMCRKKAITIRRILDEKITIQKP